MNFARRASKERQIVRLTGGWVQAISSTFAKSQGLIRLDGQITMVGPTHGLNMYAKHIDTFRARLIVHIRRPLFIHFADADAMLMSSEMSAANARALANSIEPIIYCSRRGGRLDWRLDATIRRLRVDKSCKRNA